MNTLPVPAPRRQPGAHVLCVKLRIGVLIMITALVGMAVVVAGQPARWAGGGAGAGGDRGLGRRRGVQPVRRVESDRLMARTVAGVRRRGAAAFAGLADGDQRCCRRCGRAAWWVLNAVVGGVHLLGVLLWRGLHRVAEAAQLANIVIGGLSGSLRCWRRRGGRSGPGGCRCCWRWCCSSGRRRTSGAWRSPARADYAGHPGVPMLPVVVGRAWAGAWCWSARWRWCGFAAAGAFGAGLVYLAVGGPSAAHWFVHKSVGAWRPTAQDGHGRLLRLDGAVQSLVLAPAVDNDDAGLLPPSDGSAAVEPGGSSDRSPGCLVREAVCRRAWRFALPAGRRRRLGRRRATSRRPCDRRVERGCAEAKPMPSAAQPPSATTLLDREGRPVRLSRYRGKPLLVSFIYTGCFQGPRPARCSLQAASLDRLQKGLRRPVQRGEHRLQPARRFATGAAFAAQHRSPSELGVPEPVAGASVDAADPRLRFQLLATPAGFDHVWGQRVDVEGRVFAQGVL